MKVPAREQIVGLFRSQRLLVARFVATSVGRSLLMMSGVLLIQEFLVGILGEGDGLARSLTSAIGPEAALVVLAALLVSSSLGAGYLYYDNQVTRQTIVKVVELGVMERLVRHLLTLSVPFYDRQSHGDFIQAVRQDVSHLRAVLMAYASLLMEGFVALGLIFAALLISPFLALCAFIVLPITCLPLIRIARRTRARSLTVRQTGYVLFDVILQILRGMRMIKTYRGEEAEARVTIERARRYFDELIEATRSQELANVLLESLAGMGLALVVVVGGFQVMSGSLAWPGLLAFLMAVRAAQGPLNNMNSHFMEIQRLSAAAVRIGELLDERPEVPEASEPIPLEEPPRCITFEDVSFSYDDDLPVLRNLSFAVEAGETIGVAGPSGAGKTTLLSLVARFYDPTSGSICFDGVDLRRFRLSDVYDMLAIVSQEPFLFTASIRENIRCGRPDASDREVEAAAAAADVHDEVLSFSEGYDTPVGIGGRVLSGGQAQRVAVARALLKNAPILLLDEATSSLDSIAEANVQRAIDRLMAGRTSFIVAHRLSTLRNADRILVLEGGRPLACGPHSELLRSCPLYREMWETQQPARPVVRSLATGR
ncbi:MAG: ABC transporter ATP-binding protein [Myxococcales bacterium]|nr:ABC transporter ATP-binding protein [Myxococcales bacterium]